ncbi:MAG TPA: ABC transporter ATP-binding protein [Symbiobacteriaceae bacterium]|nr:ABC transporter ATP-binding protein [Symbiobacteriaceae bacterium]
MAIVEAAGVAKVYGRGEARVRALSGVDLSIQKGEFVAIMGPSGSGKSTLLAILGGLESPSAGAVTIDGQCLASQSETQLAVMRRRKVGFIFQSFNLVPVLTAEENVAIPLLLDGLKGAAVHERAMRVLTLVGLADRATHTPAELSGGQQQRVAIARALVTEPALVLADEPTGNLDSKTSAEVMSLLRRSCDELGQTTVLITHDAGVAAWADRVLFLRDGMVVAEERQRGPVQGRVTAIRVKLEEVAAYAD